jgi:hypothetical protein
VELSATPTEVSATSGRKVGHACVWMLQAPEGVYRLRLLTDLAHTDETARNAYHERLLAYTMRKGVEATCVTYRSSHRRRP